MAIRRITYAGCSHQGTCLKCKNRKIPGDVTRRRTDFVKKCPVCETVHIYHFRGDKVIITDKAYAHLFEEGKAQERRKET